MDRRVYTGLGVGLAAIAGAGMLMKPRRTRRMRKALRSVSHAVNSVSELMGL